MSDFELLLSSIGLLLAALGVVAWFYVSRVKQAHRHVMHRLENLGDPSTAPRRAMPSFKFPNHLKVLVIALLLAAAAMLVWAIVRLAVTVLKVALIIVAVVLLVYMAMFVWRWFRGKLGERRPKIWYEDD